MKKILSPGRNCQGIYSVHQSGLLIDGHHYFREFYRAARRARRYILMAGWQFERNVRLLRGAEERSSAGAVELVPFLDGLCGQRRKLEVFILMWDFSALVALDRQWFHKWVLDLTSNDRIHFRFDSNHAVGASHHQKIVVIDGAVAFVGGLDICANSWDNRSHAPINPDRSINGKTYEPYHDVQSFHTGPVAWEITKLFQKRWADAGGENLSLAPPGRRAVNIRPTLRINADRVAVSRTVAQTLVPLVQPVREIRQLYLDAIAAAEKLLYIENQYFSSQAVYQALRERMMDPDRPRLQIVLVLPKNLHTLIEEISLSVIQAKMLKNLMETAARYEHDLGVYYSAGPGEGSFERATYIHSKVLIVDDCFLSVGSANTTNRSMGLDTELNVSWETESSARHDLVRSIRRARGNLLAEHTGLRKPSERRRLGSQHRLVEYLNSLADRQECRLRRHTMKSFLEDMSWVRNIMPEDLAIDPERPVIEETIYEMISRDPDGLFSKGLLLVNGLTHQPIDGQPEIKGPAGIEAVATVQDPGTFDKTSRGPLPRWFIFAVIILGIAGIIWLLFKQ